LIEVRLTEAFRVWLRRLRDRRAIDRINARLVRVSYGLLGDAKSIDGIGELRVDHGPGYRVYFVRRGETVVILCGGDKSPQERDIKRAKRMAEEV
jgi:putative addiction module killer protein